MLLEYTVNNASIRYHPLNHLLHLCLGCECWVLHGFFHDVFHNRCSQLFLLHEDLLSSLDRDLRVLGRVIFRGLLRLHEHLLVFRVHHNDLLGHHVLLLRESNVSKGYISDAFDC